MCVNGGWQEPLHTKTVRVKLNLDQVQMWRILLQRKMNKQASELLIDDKYIVLRFFHWNLNHDK